MNKRNRYTSEFKTKVVLEVLREEQTVNQIAAKYDLAPPMVSRWKAEFLEKAHSVFERETENKEQLKQEFQEKEERLQKLVGQLSVELDWLKKNLVSSNTHQERLAMVEWDNEKLTPVANANILKLLNNR